MEYFNIRNWKKFQHYNDRNPPWIKLHYEILSSSDWVMLDDASRVLAIACMLIASRNDGKVPHDQSYIKRVAYLKRKPNFKPLILCGFLETDSNCKQMLADARPETETETETETEGEVEAKARHLEFVMLKPSEHEILKSKLDGRTDEYIARLNDYIGSKGKKYSSHYHTIMSWWRKDVSEGKIQTGFLAIPEKPKPCSKCEKRAAYKDGMCAPCLEVR